MIAATLAPLSANGNLATTRGDSTIFYVTCTEDGAAVDLTGCKLWFTVKRNLSDLDVDAIIRRTTDTAMGIVVATPQTGIAVITLDPVQTVTLLRAETLFWDIQVRTFAGLINTAASGLMDVALDVTRGML